MSEQPEWGKNIAKYFIIPQRVILSIMGFFAIVNAYTMRICLSTVITQLVIQKNATEGADPETTCLPDPNDSGPVHHEGGEYDWSEERQGVILSSFYIGYIITHIPGGMLADKFGGKWTLGLGIFSTAIFTLLTPYAIRQGQSTYLIILRILMGLGEGTTFPALSVLLSAWVPLRERGTLGAFVLGGGQIGTILGTMISGFLLHSFVWDVTFYFFGIAATIWFIIFVFLCYSHPGSHPFIKPEEKEYLKNELGSIDHNYDLPPTPWCQILTNVPVIALIFAQIGHDWGFYTMATDLPKYMADVMRFSIKKNGIYSSFPPALMWIVSLSSGCLADVMISKKWLGLTNTRKFWTAVAAFPPAICMVAASYAGCKRVPVVLLFTLCLGFMGTYYAGMKLNPLDLSPNYSGSLMGLVNGIGALTGIMAPYLAGYMTPNATLLEWRGVMWVSFGVLTSTCVVYVIWASGEIQPFNEGKPKKNENP